MDPNIRALLLNRFVNLIGKEIKEFKKTFCDINLPEYPQEKFHMVNAGGRGIYKPKDSPFALSIRFGGDKNPYKNSLYFDDDGNFIKLIYHGPKSVKLQNRALTDLNSLIACFQGKIPFGLIYVVENKKLYRSLGLGIVKSYKNNIFEIIPYNIKDGHRELSIKENAELFSHSGIHSSSVTETEYSLNLRTAQYLFRNKLLKKYDKCFLCDIDFYPLLIASHIKPWAHSNDFERIDINNGLLLCAHHDKLFDAGYISFNNNTLVVSDMINNREIIKINNFNKLYKFNIKQQSYISYHFKKVFQNDEL